MKYFKKFREALFLTIITLCVLQSCLMPACTWCNGIKFKNCTKDTLYIGVSHYDNIDSLSWQMEPIYYKYFNNWPEVDTTGISLWRAAYVNSDECIYPDSMCTACVDDVFFNSDTCYFFLIKYRDAKQYTWDEIRNKRLYRRHVVVRDAEGNFDMNIRYKDN